MEVSRGANLVGMSMIPLDACPLSLLIKKKITYQKQTNMKIIDVVILLVNYRCGNFTKLPCSLTSQLHLSFYLITFFSILSSSYLFTIQMTPRIDFVSDICSVIVCERYEQWQLSYST